MVSSPVAHLVKAAVGAAIAVALIAFLSAGALVRSCDGGSGYAGEACSPKTLPMALDRSARAAS